MIKYFIDKWNKNQKHLKSVIENSGDLDKWDYIDIVKLVVDNILNHNLECSDYKFDSEQITEINNGEYQGTLLYVIPVKTYQPNESEYIMTFVDYGSCSGCDTLQAIQSEYSWKQVDKSETVKDFMTLCKDLVCNMVKPYNTGWRKDDRFVECKLDNE